jgi:hypothetical protein
MSFWPHAKALAGLQLKSNIDRFVDHVGGDRRGTQL